MKTKTSKNKRRAIRTAKLQKAPAKPVTSPKNQAMVAALTDLLELAKRDELLMVAVAGVLPGNNVVHMLSGSDHVFSLMGVLEVVKRDIMKRVE